MQTIINNELKFEELSFVICLSERKSPFIKIIKEVYDDVKDILNSRIQTIFPKYTLHNTDHSFRIIQYMYKLVDDPNKLTELEITLLICSALLHDIGMGVSERDLDLIKTDSYAFCDVKYSAMLKLTDGNGTLAMQEYIRRIHADLSGKYIRENLKSKLTIPNLLSLDFTNELALICESHTKDYDWIKANLNGYDVRGDYHFNAQFVASILRLADILDIDANRTPYRLYEIIAPTGVSDDEWKQHFVISNNEKIIVNDKTLQKKIVFHGKAKNASIHRKILTYIDWVKNELVNAVSLVSGKQPQYSLLYDTTPEVHIQTEGYSFSDYKMTLQFEAISALLMGEKIYGNKSLGLRELVQNSIDACRIRQENELSTQEFGEDQFVPKIRVILDSLRNQVIISDNGVGMSIDVIKKHFLNIGVSYYKSNDFLLKDLSYKPIGNFGIGFLSCFMLSDQVVVNTRFYKSKDKYKIELERGDEWTSLTKTEDVNFDGTEVILNYLHFMQVFENKVDKVKEFLMKYFLTDGIDFKLINKPPNESISEIENCVTLLTPLEKGIIKIDLQDYLKDIDGYVLIKHKENFIKTFDDLDFFEEVYKHEEDGGLQPIEDVSVLRIADYFSDNQIKYLSIPIVEYDLQDDYLNGLKFTDDDVSEVIDKMKKKLRWISVLFRKEIQQNLDDIYVEAGEDIYESLSFNDLVKIGHSEECKIKIDAKRIKLFEGRQNELYLPFEETKKSQWYHRFEKQRKELFVRSVLIRDFQFDIPIVASIFDVDTIVVNLNSRKFIPDISRNNFDDKTRSEINYFVGKAIHKAAKTLLSLNEDETLTVEKFITAFYSDHTEFEK